MNRGKIPFFNVPRCNEKGEVCFYFFEKLKIFQKNKNKLSFPVAAWHIKHSSKNRILLRFMFTKYYFAKKRFYTEGSSFCYKNLIIIEL
jgi:hypothetical protein